jgi:hypothetical protein
MMTTLLDLNNITLAYGAYLDIPTSFNTLNNDKSIISL